VPVSPQQRAKLPQEPTAEPSSLPARAPAPPTQAEPATSIRGDDLLGEWKGSFVNRNQPKKFTLHIKQAENNALRAEGKADTWTLLELFEGSLVGNTVILRGYEVKPTPAPGKNYSLDVFKLTLSADGKTLKGTWTDTDKSTGDIEVSRVGSISSLSATQALVKAPAIKEDGLDQQIRADADEAISAAFKSGSTKEYLYNAGSARQTLWREAADSGVAEALWLMGCCYDNGVGISAPDPVRAFEYYLKSADKDYGPALNDVGLCYGLGKGVAKDLMRAVQYYKRAASKNRPSAWFNLGSCYEQGLGGLPKDSKQAIDCYKKAKDLGYGLAEKALARFHQ